MARGKKIQLRIVENPTRRRNLCRQKRNGLLKTASELSVTCDAEISILGTTERGRCFTFISSSSSTKDVIDRYQRYLGFDLWSEHYERMEDDLKKLKETNMSLRMQIGRAMGENLDDLSFAELVALEREMQGSVEAIRKRKERNLQNHLEVWNRKIKRMDSLMKCLLTGRVDPMDDPSYGAVDNGGLYDCKERHISAFIPDLNQAEAESCLTHSSSEGETESVTTPCSGLNPPDAETCVE